MVSKTEITEKKRLTIGLMANLLDAEYQMQIWAGVEDAAKKYDVNVLCFAGDQFEQDNEISPRNEIFSLISSRSIDGLFVVSSVMTAYIGINKLKTYLERFNDIPIISFGLKIDGIDSVVLEDQKDFLKLMDHLIVDHGYKKFLFVGGSKDHLDAVERKNLFIESLKKHNLSIDHDYIREADFVLAKAYEIVCEFLDRNEKLDAIVFANDNMAIYSLKAFYERNINLPEDVAITGFDDIHNAANISIPLTTIHQPIYEMANKAMKLLIAKIKGEKIPPIESFKSNLVIRRSCGCFSYNKDIDASDESIDSDKLPVDFPKIKENILNEVKEKSGLTFSMIDKEMINSLMDNFLYQILEHDKSYKFLKEMDSVLRKTVISNFDDRFWENFILILRKNIIPYFINKNKELIYIENLFQHVNIIIIEITRQNQYQRRHSLLEKMNTMQVVMESLLDSFDIYHILSKLAVELPKIKIMNCFLALHSSQEKLFDDENLVFALNNGKEIQIERSGYKYNAKDIFPKEIIKMDCRYNIMVEPLIYKFEQLGFIMLELSPFDVISSRIISKLISSMLKASVIVQDIINKEQELNNIIIKLNDNQEKLLISEKMAFLGRLTAGIAHEMNTPLAAGRSALKSLEGFIDEYRKSINNKEVTAEDHLEIINDMTSQINLVKSTLEKSVSFIKGIKGQTTNMTQKPSVYFPVKDIINDALSIIFHLLYSNKCVLKSEIDEDIKLYGNPIYLNEIVTNLIVNAIDACKPDGGEIFLNIKKDNGNMILIVKDTGCGIPSEHLSKVYDPLFTTKPFGEGTGLGLNIVQNLVEEFKGTIDIKSKPDDTIFTITIPIEKKENLK